MRSTLRSFESRDRKSWGKRKESDDEVKVKETKVSVSIFFKELGVGFADRTLQSM